jgi:hypothetical protein
MWHLAGTGTRRLRWLMAMVLGVVCLGGFIGAPATADHRTGRIAYTSFESTPDQGSGTSGR